MELNLKRKKTLDVVVEEINKIIEWWMDNYPTAPISMLIDARSKLTAYLFTFATYIGETKAEQLAAETQRKIKKSQKRKECIGADYSIAKSEDEAILSTESEQKKADDYEGYYITLRLMLDQANKVDDAIQQRIGILRKEKENI